MHHASSRARGVVGKGGGGMQMKKYEQKKKNDNKSVPHAEKSILCCKQFSTDDPKTSCTGQDQINTKLSAAPVLHKRVRCPAFTSCSLTHGGTFCRVHFILLFFFLGLNEHNEQSARAGPVRPAATTVARGIRAGAGESAFLGGSGPGEKRGRAPRDATTNRCAVGHMITICTVPVMYSSVPVLRNGRAAAGRVR